MSKTRMGIRGGAATVFYQIWHYEVESLLVLKNNRGTEENRVRHLDYGVKLNKHFYKTAMAEDPTYYLFSPDEVPGLLEAFETDQEEFERLYDMYSKDKSIRKREVNAFDLLSTLLGERQSTGRVYIVNIDHMNNYSPFDSKKAPIHQSNLCVTGDTLLTIKDRNGEIQNLPIKTLEKKWVTTFNGKEWTEAYVDKTSDEATVYHVTVSKHVGNGQYLYRNIKTTLEHIFYYYTDKEQTEPIKGNLQNIIDYYVENKPVYVDVIDENGNISKGTVSKVEIFGKEPTWCCNEPKEHKATFNNIITGQCLEIALPTSPLKDVGRDSEGEIALCTLSAVNMLEMIDEDGNILYDKLESSTRNIVRALDELLDYQNYPNKMAEIPAKARRNLGVGVINFAAWAAAKNIKYTDPRILNETDEFFEAFAFFLIKASCELAKEKGACEWYHDTLWAKGILPFERANKNALSLVTREKTFSTNKEVIEKYGSWEDIRQMLLTTGIRNSTLMAIAPTETSSIISNATNGIEPPRALLSNKINKDVIMRQLVPNVEKWAKRYTLLWEMGTNKGTIDISAIMQIYVCQSISTNTNYDPEIFPDSKVPMKVLMRDLLYAHRMGIKTLYYQNIRDGQKDGDVLASAADNCAGGACVI